MSLRVGGDPLWMGHLAILLVTISEFLAGLVLVRNALAGASKSGWDKLSMMGWRALTVGILLVVSTLPLGFVGWGLFSDWMQFGGTAYFDPARGGGVVFFL